MQHLRQRLQDTALIRFTQIATDCLTHTDQIFLGLTHDLTGHPLMFGLSLGRAFTIAQLLVPRIGHHHRGIRAPVAKGGFNGQNGTRDPHQGLVTGLHLSRQQLLDHRDLFSQDCTQRILLQHTERIRHAGQTLDQRLQVGHAAAVTAHKDIEDILDA